MIIGWCLLNLALIIFIPSATAIGITIILDDSDYGTVAGTVTFILAIVISLAVWGIRLI